jgi:hypothetical protein
MKKLLTIAACFCALTAFNAYAQGTIAFGNRVTGVLDAPVFDVGGTVKLEGPAMAQLYLGATPVGAPVAFRTGAGAGYWPTTSVTLPGVAAGAVAQVQVKAWKDAASFEAAAIKGESGVLSITTGGAGSPPTLPANLVGLTSFTLVPEPSMIALGLLGAAGLMLRRRK